MSISQVECNSVTPDQCIYRDSTDINIIRRLAIEDSPWNDKISITIGSCHHAKPDDYEYNMKYSQLFIENLPLNSNRLPALTSLHISIGRSKSVVITDTILKSLKNLKYLHLYNVTIQGDSSTLALPNLEQLELSKCTFEDGRTVYELISLLNESSTNLNRLYLYNILTSDPSIVDNSVKPDSILEWDDLAEDDTVCVRELPIHNLTNLQSLVLRNCYIDAAIPKDLSTLSKLKCVSIQNSVLRSMVKSRLEIDRVDLGICYIMRDQESIQHNDRFLVLQLYWLHSEDDQE